MASYACPRCGTIGDSQPCATCGAAAFDLETEADALRFSLARRTRLRAGLGAGIGCVVGFVHSAWLQGDTHDRHYPVLIAWVIILAAVGAMIRPRAVAELEDRLGRARNVRKLNWITLAFGALVIIFDTAVIWHDHVSTMPKKDAEKLVVEKMCELAKTCTKGVFCMGVELNIDLQMGHKRVEKDDLDDCLHALGELQARHEQCAPPPIPACEAVTRTTIPRLLEEAHQMNREIDKAIDQELRKSLDRLPPR